MTELVSRRRPATKSLSPFGRNYDLWEDFFSFPSLLGSFQGPEGGSLPSIDISETESEYLIEADLPGFDPKDVSVEIEHDGISISGKYEQAHEKKEKSYHCCERSQGSFYRKIALPSHFADFDSITCKSKNGVLTITVPKKEESKKKKVKIEVQE